MSRGAGLLLCLTIAALTSGCAALRGGPGVAPLPTEARLDPGKFVVVTVANDMAPAATAAGSTPRGYDQAGAYWISYRVMSAVRGLEHDYGMREASAWPIQSLGVQCILFRIRPQAVRAGLLARLVRDPRVKSAERLNDFATEATAEAPGDAPRAHASYLRLERNLRELDVIAAHRLSQGAGVRVAVIDTGLDFEHPDLRGRVAARRDFVAGGGRSFQIDVHGTEVAGVIAARAADGSGLLGVAPQSHLLALKACWPVREGQARAVCDSFTLAQALEAALLARVNIINLSLAGPADPLLAQLVREALRRGIVVVGARAAADADGQFPSDIQGVLAVESAEDARAARATRSLSAPGRDILTLVPGGHYDFASGSSLAAAEVSGVVALLLTSRPGLTPAAVRDILVRSSQRIFTPRGALTTVNACDALAMALSRASCHAVAAPEAGARRRLPGRRGPDVEHSRGGATVGVAFRQHDPAVDHDGAVPVARPAR